MKTVDYYDPPDNFWTTVGNLLWCEKDGEIYAYDTADEAIEASLDGAIEHTGTIDVLGGRHPAIAKLDALRYLKGALESMDVDYGINPDDEPCWASGPISTALNVIAEVVAREYEPWYVDEVVRVRVDVRRWVREHRPGWPT